MVYAQPSDMIARYPNRDLVQLTNEDPTQQVVDDSVLQQALADASAEIDGYLESRFTLPLSDAPAVLARLTCDIAMYRLQALRPLHDLAERAGATRTRWRSWCGLPTALSRWASRRITRSPARLRARW
jgi:phage gp36-like protein